jgi:exopolysaccharide biosynthesis polyprenyl glycosylphosphotransferase
MSSDAIRALPLTQSWTRGPILPLRRWVQAAYVCVDAFLACVIALVIYLVRYEGGFATLVWSHDVAPLQPVAYMTGQYVAFLLLYVVLLVLVLASHDLYRTERTRTSLDESLAVLKAVLIATLLLTAFIYLSNVKTISRLIVGVSGVLNVLVLSAWRIWKRDLIKRRVASERGARNVLIVGATSIGQDLARYLTDQKYLGYIVKGFVDANHCTDPRVLGRLEDLSAVARANFIDEIFITVPYQREVVRSLALEARQHRLNVNVVPELYDLGWRSPLEYLGDFPVMALHHEPIPALGLLVKRLADIVLSASALLLLLPLLAAIAIAIKFNSPGPVLYRSVRVGRKGVRFICYKFRSMVSNAEGLRASLEHMNEREGPLFKIKNDPRITRLGRMLRKYSLDELPQLWNVLIGDMSLVGPRPPVPDECAQYRLEYLRRLDVKPGLTGLWQVYGRKNPSFEKALSLDVQYIEAWNLWLDLQIILRTIPVLWQGGGC